MIVLSDDEISRYYDYGLKLSHKYLRRKNVLITDLISSEIESLVNEVLALCLNRFQEKYNLEFNRYYRMQILCKIKDFVRDHFGRNDKQKLRTQAQHVPYLETWHQDKTLLCQDFDDMLIKSIDKNRIFQSLPKRQRRVLTLVAAGYLENEIGQIVGGLSKQRINQIKQEAIENAQKFYSSIQTATPIQCQT